jgi:hypothetical protein
VQDKPAAEELLDALAAFLDTRVAPKLGGRDRFHAIVGANVARIVARELRLGPVLMQREYAMLCELLDVVPAAGGGRTDDVLRLTAALIDRIERGDADDGEFRDRVLAFLRESVAAKLAVADPKRLAGEAGE